MAGHKIACVHCAHEMEAPAGPPAAGGCCPACGSGFPAPEGLGAAPGETLTAAVEAASVGGPACPFCLSVIGPAEPTVICPGCKAVYHPECWQENGGCGVYGCVQAAPVENRSGIEIPVSYWGQEHKPCPACGQQILAAAVRCRHCGAQFASARPQDTVEFQRRIALEESLPQARRQLVWIFVFSVLPFLAPVGAVWGLIWRRSHDREIAALPVIYRALSKIALITAISLSLMLVALTCLYALVKSG